MGGLLWLAAILASVAAQSTSSSPTTSSATFTATMGMSVDDFWNMYIGPVDVASVNTTVSPTPIPSSELIPPPPIYYSPFPSGQQIALQTKNESWSFPKDFWYGVASAAFQVEGAVKDEGRGPSIWDYTTHRVTNFVTLNMTADVADNHYYLYKQDIARVAALGIKAYSFSISWSRIFPFGSGQVNEQALAHYGDVIDTCIEYGVSPHVTLFHWDTPLFLQNSYGGWLGDQVVPDFVEYARVVFSRYGNKVSHWFTVNEPLVFCGNYPLPEGYFRNFSIPWKQQSFVCSHNVLLAHAQSYRLAKSLNLAGPISFKNNGGYKIPLTNSTADLEATQRAYDFNEGLYADPIFLTGDYPASVKEYVSSFLPDFTEEEKAQIKGSADLFAHDAYTSQFYFAPDDGIEGCLANTSNPLYPSCTNTSYTYSDADGGWNIGPAADQNAPWLHKATDWVPRFLRDIQDRWKPTAIAVSEFGFAEPFEYYKTIKADILYDPIRSSYYQDYLEGVLMAIADGINVVGCLAWSIFDNLEWNSAYTVKFGIQYVNLTTQERFYKASAFTYVNMFKQYQES